MRSARLFRSSVALFLGGTLPLPLDAVSLETFTWTGVADNDLGNPENWVDGTVPQIDDSASMEDVLLLPDRPVSLLLETAYYLNSLTVESAENSFNTLSAASPVTITLGSGGLSVSGGNGTSIESGVSIALVANQTWAVGGTLDVKGIISGDYALTKAGPGTLLLHGANTFSGGLTVAEGSVYLGGSSILGDFPAGPAGTGPLTLQDNVTLGAIAFGVTLANDISLGNNVHLGAQHGQRLTLDGTITPAQAGPTTINLLPRSETFFRGPIIDHADGTGLTFAGHARAWLGDGSNSTNINTYSGGTTADGAAVIFTTPESIPGSGTIRAENGGYIGVAFDGGAATLLGDGGTTGRIAAPEAFHGWFGLDTADDQWTTTFSDLLDFSAFAPDMFLGLGSHSHASVNGTITPVGEGNYRFGGGPGKLYVNSVLDQPVHVDVDSPPDAPLTVILSGANTFTGDLNVTRSVVVLDSASALPGGSSFNLGHEGYVGYTQAFTPAESFAAFIARKNSHEATSILGIDTNDSSPHVLDNLDLSALTSIYVGSNSHTQLTGTIKAPSSEGSRILALLGARDGWVDVLGDLTADYVDSVTIGSPNSAMSGAGIVRLTSEGNTYTGGTTFQNGFLLVGSDNALGTGSLSVNTAGQERPLILVPAPPPEVSPTTGPPPPPPQITLLNRVEINGGGTLQIGVPAVDSGPSSRLNQYSTGRLHLAGDIVNPISGGEDGMATLRTQGAMDLTLSGDNGSFTGKIELRGDSRVIGASDTALGTGPIDVGAGADLTFTTSHPTIGSLTGGQAFDRGDGLDQSYLVLPEGSSLTINQTADGWFHGAIGGAPGGAYNNDSPAASVGATLVKEGASTLALSGSGTYTGGTTVNAGTLVAANGSSLGTGAVTVNGGTLAVQHHGSVSNDLVLNSGRLSGNGSFTTATIVSGFTLAPGWDMHAGSNATGAMVFQDLTLQGGGILEWNLYDPSPDSLGWDRIVVTSTLTLPNPADARFVLKLSTVGSGGQSEVIGDFEIGQTYSWLVFETQGIEGFAADAFAVDVSGFLTGFNVSENDFALSMAEGEILLNFTPVPEPSTYALILVGLGISGLTAWRRRRS